MLGNAKVAQRIRPMVKDDLKQVFAWRNHLEIRRYMFNTKEITLAEHTDWFERTSLDHNRHLLIFEVGAASIGFINFYQIGSGGVADWGFYAAPDAPKGTGRHLGHAALKYAFVDLKFHRLCGQVLAFNNRSIRFHINLGFQQEGLLRKHHFDGNEYHDVMCFGLLAYEWRLDHREISI